MKLQNDRVQSETASELESLIAKLERTSPDQMPMLLPSPQEIQDLMDRWKNADREMWNRMNRMGTLELQAKYRLMLMTKQLMLDPKPDAATRAEQDNLLMQ